VGSWARKPAGRLPAARARLRRRRNSTAHYPATQPMFVRRPRIIANTLALRERGVTRDTPSPQADGGQGRGDRRAHGRVAERAQFLVKRGESEVDPGNPCRAHAIEWRSAPPRCHLYSRHRHHQGRVQAYQLLARADACQSACTCSCASSSRISTSTACVIWVSCTASARSGCRLAVSR